MKTIFLQNPTVSLQKNPLVHLAPHSYPSDFQWNPNGDNLLNQSFTFGMVRLDEDLTTKVKDLAKQNEESAKKDEHVAWSAEFTYPMTAKKNSVHCLDKNTCLPVGGYSVISSFTPIRTGTKKILISTKMDTTALFRAQARGAQDAMSGLVAMLLALNILSRTAADALRSADTEVIFAIFDAETYDLAGSRRWVEDVQNFTCRMDATDVYPNGCWEPYHTSMYFQNITLDEIDFIIDVGPVGIRSEPSKGFNAFLHTEKDMRADEDTLRYMNMTYASALEEREESAAQLNIEQASASNPGTPPSSLWSFLNAKPNQKGFVLTDFDTEFTNKYMHSLFDKLDDIDNTQICLLGKVLAKTVYRMVTGEEDSTHITMNGCKLVEKLLNCFVNDMTCSTVTEYYSDASEKDISHYSSVYMILEDFNIEKMNQFLLRYVADLTKRETTKDLADCSTQEICMETGTVCAKDKCVDSSTYFHSAVDPNIYFDYSSNQWLIREEGKGSMLWTESYWMLNIGCRFYKTESPTVVFSLIILGCGILISSMCIAFYGASVCKRKFKIL